MYLESPLLLLTLSSSLRPAMLKSKKQIPPYNLEYCVRRG